MPKKSKFLQQKQKAVAIAEKTWYNEKKVAKECQKMKLYFIRHGQPIYDPDSLTPLGEE